MTIAIFGRITRTTDFVILRDFFRFLQKEGTAYFIYDEYARNLARYAPLNQELGLLQPVFRGLEELPEVDFLFSIGGDGTFLDSVRMVGQRAIPIVGINVGRLGFLANSNQHELKDLTKKLIAGNWIPQKRTLLALESNPSIIFHENSFAINEITIHKSNSNEMIIIHTYVDGEFLNSYWADGLIVSTPTGSTAYSLACGGPIIIPQANTWVITPIAPHSLTVRPIILPTESVITFEMESRSGQCLVALDNRNELIQEHVRILVKKADFDAVLVTFEETSYFETLRNRLNWGVDSRN